MPPTRHDRLVHRARALVLAAAGLAGAVTSPLAGADGAFAVTVPAGTYALTATHPQWVAAYSPPAAVSGKVVRDLRLLAPAEGFLLAGDTRDSTGAALTDAQVHCLRTMSKGDLFVGRADAAERYALRLPSSPYYGCHVAAGELRSPLVDVDGSARVVALGEATHGTREFFQVKHRLLEYLVSELGFNVFAIEPGSRVVLWAANWHISNHDTRFTSMGHHLEAALGKDYLPVGFLFHHGGFRAIDATGQGRRGPNELTVGPLAAGTLEDTFERAGWPLCLLDLRRLPASGPVTEWFRRPQLTRAVGSSFSGEADMAMEMVLPDRYEAVIYVEATTRARPNPPAQPGAASRAPASG